MTRKNKKGKTKKISSVRITLRNTSAFEDSKVWEALRHVVPALKLKKYREVDVTISKRHDGDYGARCYPDGCDYHTVAPDKPLVKVRISADEKYFPCMETHESGQGYIDCLILDSMECLVHLLAHEFRHFWQYEHPTSCRDRIWGSRGVVSNRDADAYAIRKMREYRRRTMMQSRPYSVVGRGSGY
jgi:hypothetical protein